MHETGAAPLHLVLDPEKVGRGFLGIEVPDERAAPVTGSQVRKVDGSRGFPDPTLDRPCSESLHFDSKSPAAGRVMRLTRVEQRVTSPSGDGPKNPAAARTGGAISSQ